MTTLFMDGFGRHWWLLVLYGVLGVLVGLYAMVSPLEAAVALAWAIGVMALAEGVVGLAALFANGAVAGRGWMLFYALISLLFGLLAVTNPAATAGALLLVLACWFVVAGVFRVLFAFQIRRHVRGEWVIAVTGLLGIVLGGLFLAKPLAGLVVATIWFGVGMLIYGVLQIVAGLRLRSLHNRAF